MYENKEERPEVRCFFMMTELLSDPFNEEALFRVETNLSGIRKIAKYYEKNIGCSIFSLTEEQSAKLFVRMYHKVDELVRTAK